MLKDILLVLQRLRVTLGVTFGFILMYGAFIGNLTGQIFLIALGLLVIHIFGEFYNDYTDYEQDLRNQRDDKPTVRGIMTPKQARNISFLLLPVGLILAALAGFYILILGLAFAIVSILYSHPKFYLKRYDIFGYFIVGLIFFFFPVAINLSLAKDFSLSHLLFSLFFFSQVVYLSSQKDSTDIKGTTNLFLNRGWKNSAIITFVFAATASMFLLFISIPMFVFWLFNLFIKLINVNKIFNRTITRSFRRKLIGFEFLTPYIYFIGFAG